MKDLKLDAKQLIAERKARYLRELELNGGPSASNDDSMPLTPNFSDSMLLESPSQGASQSITDSTGNKLDRIVVLDIFDNSQLFRIFSEEDINFSMMGKSASSFNDVPKLSHDDMVTYIESELQAKVKRNRSASSKVTSRYLLFLMSVTTSEHVLEVCLNILKQQISEAFFCIEISDFLIILMNYGTIKSKLWSDEVEFSRHKFKKFPANSFSEEQVKNKDLRFPRLNFERILSLLRFNISTFPAFSEDEKAGLVHLLLNLSMVDFVLKDDFLTVIIKDIIASLLDSYTEEEWCDLDSKRVEDLVLKCWHDELDPVGIVQRITSLPISTRGRQLQAAAAYFGFQYLMDIEEVNLCGRVSLNEVHKKVMLLNQNNWKDFVLFHCVMELIFLSFDLGAPSVDTEKLKSILKVIKEARKRIREISVEMDSNRIAVKDLMCQIGVWIKDSIPKDNVV